MPSQFPQPQHGPQIVASWVYGSINPLLNALTVEMSFLERRSITWRFTNKRLEFVRPLREYLSPMVRPVYLEFIQAIPDAQHRFGEHDDLVLQIERLGTEAFKSIVTEPFTRRVNTLLKAHIKRGLPYPGGSYSEEQFPLLIAQNIVNRVEEIPEHYSDADFWSRHRREFLQMARGESFEKLDQRREQLLALDRGLVAWLQETSNALRSRHDLPASPFPWLPLYPFTSIFERLSFL